MAAEVEGVRAIDCRSPQPRDCRVVAITATEGEREGTRSTLRIGEALTDFDPEVVDAIQVVRNEIPAGTAPGAADRYTMVDFERRSLMLWFAIAFALLLVVVFGQRRGALALLGLAAASRSSTRS